MLKDGKEFKLTKEEAIQLHRQMWRDMAEEEEKLGKPIDRTQFKNHWCREHGYFDVSCDCFLCEYDTQQGGKDCNQCPINWGLKPDGEPRGCNYSPDLHFANGFPSRPLNRAERGEYLKEHPDIINYIYSPIEKIAEAPLKEDKEDEE